MVVLQKITWDTKNWTLLQFRLQPRRDRSRI